jgi:hypothetical protein
VCTLTKSANPDASDPWQRELAWMVWAVVAAFGTYFCMYGFRKPYTAGDFADTTAWGLDFKTVLVTAQVLGYMVSKFIGIKLIAEMPPRRRALGILVLVGLAQAALVLFGIVPRPWNAICLFLNGLPLGMVFGLVLGFLEGRRATEALTAGLCASFILADGVTKSVGAWLLLQGVPADWMPSVAGWLFAVPLLIGVAMLAAIPPPSRGDIAARTVRVTLTRAERWALAGRFSLGLGALVLMFLLVTILRSIRADFAPELWRGLGETAQPSTFAISETIVALGVLIVNGGSVFIRGNRQAFMGGLATCAAGFVLIGLALVGHWQNLLDAFAFMVLVGLGLYLPYVAVHTTVFERLLAMTRERGNLGFLMYVADSFGYLGYVAIMLVRIRSSSADLIGFFLLACLLATVVSLACLVFSWQYFHRLEERHAGGAA